MDATRQHAIVIGGSMSGMLAARVLSDHFEHVTLIDRDHLPETVEFRDGAPQSRHLHVLLARGLQIVQDLFPGIENEMTSKGAVTVRWGIEATTYLERGWMPAFYSGVETHGISRILLEWCVRQRIRANPHIQLMERTTVKSLLTTDNNRRVTGVEIQEKGNTTQSNELKADLVVDVSGRTSHTPEWLESMGYGKVEETVVNSFLGYSTRWYKRPATFPKDKKMLTILAKPPDVPRGGVIMEIENGDCIVTLAGANKDYPPTDEAGFLDFAKRLLSPTIYEIIREAEPISNIYGYQRTENRWRHYEHFERWPDGFMVMGDAACAFNPIYGQGMTVGAMEAVAMGKLLGEYAGKDNHGMTKLFQTRLSKEIETPWLMATGEDLRYPGTVGGKTGMVDRLVQKYIERFINTIPVRPEIAEDFTQVMNLLEPPPTLFKPMTVLKVVGSLFGPKKVSSEQVIVPKAEVPSKTPTLMGE